jgi:N-acetylneuraminate synthase
VSGDTSRIARKFDRAERVVIAEVGINHNGDVALAMDMATAAAAAGADAVKLQKRTVERVYSPTALAARRESPFGTTNGQLKHGLELRSDDFRAIVARCRSLDIDLFASAWDLESLAFLEALDPPCHKVPSALVTHTALLEAVARTGRRVLLSTGMSTVDELDAAVEILGRDRLVLLHCVSAYPTPPDQINLRRIGALRHRYGCPVGYSGHEAGIAASLAAVACGAVVVERHFTLDPSMWGSDQALSLSPALFADLVAGVHIVEAAMGSAELGPLVVEAPAREKLRDLHFEHHGGI